MLSLRYGQVLPPTARQRAVRQLTQDLGRVTGARLWVCTARLGQEFDNVEGGTHQPLEVGPGTDAQVIFVVYNPSQ